MIITISGKPGSGKTTIGRRLADNLGYDFISVGDLRAEIAERHGMTIQELNKLGLKQSWTDKEVDKRIEKLGRAQDNLVVDGRMAWHFIPGSVKVFFDVDMKLAAERIFRNQRPDERPVSSVEEMEESIKERLENTQARFEKWYGVNFLDLSNYDILVDTTDMAPEEVVSRILEMIENLDSSNV